LEKFAAAFVTYAGVIATIYGISQKASEFLKKQILTEFSNPTAHPISRVISKVLPATILIVDSAFRYKKGRRFWVPSFRRSALFSFLMILILALPIWHWVKWLNPKWDFEFIIAGSVTRELRFFWPYFACAFAINIIVDYISFIKTRTLLDRFHSVKFPKRELTIVFLDVSLSLLICAFAQIAILLVIGVFFFLIVVIFGVFVEPGKILDMVEGVFQLVVFLSPLAFLTFSITIISFVTSLGIAAISAFIAALQITSAIIRKIEGLRLWSFLNFEENPMQASAVVLIVIFSPIYWALILIVQAL
jgi:hypothetical protein